jgi:hypothetical protein
MILDLGLEFGQVVWMMLVFTLEDNKEDLMILAMVVSQKFLDNK